MSGASKGFSLEVVDAAGARVSRIASAVPVDMAQAAKGAPAGGRTVLQNLDFPYGSVEVLS